MKEIPSQLALVTRSRVMLVDRSSQKYTKERKAGHPEVAKCKIIISGQYVIRFLSVSYRNNCRIRL